MTAFRELGGNQLTGTIPPEFMGFKKMIWMYVSLILLDWFPPPELEVVLEGRGGGKFFAFIVGVAGTSDLIS